MGGSGIRLPGSGSTVSAEGFKGPFNTHNRLGLESTQHSSGLVKFRDAGPKLVVFMVGLPARGKSYISGKVCRYLTWLGFATRVFNVGNRRRTVASGDKSTASGEHCSSFFDPANHDARGLRNKIALDSLDELLDWLLHEDGEVGIHDATNSTVERRSLLVSRCRDLPNVTVMFLESICTDREVLDQNIRMKLFSPDYKNMKRDDALRDFEERVKNYEKAYEPVGAWEEENGVSYLTLVNVGRKIISYQIYGYLPSQIMFYLTNIHIQERTIWLTRHGESLYNLEYRIGGDPGLSEKGVQYARALKRFFDEQLWSLSEKTVQKRRQNLLGNSLLHSRCSSSPRPADLPLAQHALSVVSRSISCSSSHTNLSEQFARARDRGRSCSTGGTDALVRKGSPRRNSGSARVKSYLPSRHAPGESHQPSRIMSSLLRRAIETVAYFDPEESTIQYIKALNELSAGACEDMTLDEIEAAFPGQLGLRAENKLYYRYPGIGAESYLDVIERLKPIIVETERLTIDVMIVTHNVVMRTLLGYFLNVPNLEMSTMEVPLHRLYALSPKPYGTEVQCWDWEPLTDEWVKVKGEPFHLKVQDTARHRVIKRGVS